MASEPLTEVLAYLERELPAMVDDLRTLVHIETPSHDKTALDEGLARILEWMEERLGRQVHRRVDGGSLGDAVRVDLPGSGKPVAVLCHYDTVWPVGTIAERPFVVEGQRATGPGAFDMKTGLVQFVWALRALDHVGIPVPPIRLVLNGDEEIGSLVSLPVIEEACAGAEVALVFEPSADGAIKTARKGVGIYQVHATGVESHSGMDPTDGASAVVELARVTLALHELTDLSLGTTINVGTFHGGTGSNVIAGEATIEIDVRASIQSEADRIDRIITGLTSTDPRVTLRVTGGWNRPVMERTERTGALFLTAALVAESLGFPLEEKAVGGASDGNFASRLGLAVLDGLGAVGAGAHARNEYVELSEMPRRAALAAGVLAALA